MAILISKSWKRTFITLGILMAIVLFGVAAAGLYPVALINGSPIFFAEWRRLEDAVISASSLANTINETGIETTSSPLDIKRDTLNLLIDQRIIAQEGDVLIEDFESKGRTRVIAAVSATNNLEEPAELLYGMSQDDFIEFVLRPQAYQDMLFEHFNGEYEDLASWFLGVKKEKRVTLFFVPFDWTGEEAR